MYLTDQTIQTLRAGLSDDLAAFLPELILSTGLVLLLVLRLFRAADRAHLGWITLVITAAALVASYFQWHGPGATAPGGVWQSNVPAGATLFSGLLAYDAFAIFLRLFLCSFAALVTWLCLLTGIPDREDSADFFCLLLGATVGMSLMASANHLLMVYIGVEMASLPSYALAGFLKGRRQSSEAALKYVVYGGGASGIMLYGISLLAGKFGTAYLPDLALAYATPMTTAGATDPVVLLGTLFVLVGLGFKLAAVPFHFWCPDVFEGAAAEVAAFLSVASKGAALALTARLALTLAGLTTSATPEQWQTVASYLAPALAFFAALTATFGNLAAYAQTNLKRLLAYSTIAHAGYMMMGLATLNREGASAVLFYLIAYLFMNLGAFAVVAFLRNQTGSEDLTSFSGLVHRAPLMTVLLGVFLLSLLGMPPLAGFAAKFQIFSALFDAGRGYTAQGNAGLGYIMYALLVIGGINTAISAVYYLRVLKVMALDRPQEQTSGDYALLPSPVGPAFYGVVLAIMILIVGIAWNPLARASDSAARAFQRSPRPVQIAKGG